MNCLAVIPARYASTRLPGKPLVLLAGKPMIRHVWERVRLAKGVSSVVVATDDERVLRAVESFGGHCVMTRAAHRSGTERCAEVAAGALGKDADVLVNVQGDEPLIEPAAIDAAIEALAEDSQAPVATLAVPIAVPSEIMDPNVVKAVLDFEGRALYFSRAPIPWVRDRDGLVHARHWKHLGLYVYRREALLEFPTLPMGDLERVEQLEQLRWLENGYSIRVAETSHDSVSVDVPADVERVERLMREMERERKGASSGSGS
ncbi:MAG TPA: 3-deoxy-manno-octulosonate cytidylyltransferase [Methylomirabilota bacterium]|nr:3-deoxy-manno-octulosonate cytidylyltransferase [Methylomirabilota bacterium]